MKLIGKFVLDSTAGVEVSALANVPFTESKISSCGMSTNGNTVVSISKAGVYEISYNGTFEALNTDNIEVQLLEDGLARSGAHDIVSPIAADDIVSVAFTDVVTVPCNCCVKLAVRTTSEVTALISSLIVVKVA